MFVSLFVRSLVRLFVSNLADEIVDLAVQQFLNFISAMHNGDQLRAVHAHKRDLSAVFACITASFRFTRVCSSIYTVVHCSVHNILALTVCCILGSSSKVS